VGHEFFQASGMTRVRLLYWRRPYREDDPKTGFVVGEVVNFQPGPAGSG